LQMIRVVQIFVVSHCSPVCGAHVKNAREHETKTRNPPD